MPSCPLYGDEGRLIDSSDIYGKDFGMLHYCGCDLGGCYVCCRKGTSRPLGTMACLDLRVWRKRDHGAFDPIWRCWKESRSSAYRWIGEEMGLSSKDCHIAMFDQRQCRVVEELSLKKRGKKNGKLSIRVPEGLFGRG